LGVFGAGQSSEVLRVRGWGQGIGEQEDGDCLRAEPERMLNK